MTLKKMVVFLNLFLAVVLALFFMVNWRSLRVASAVDPGYQTMVFPALTRTPVIRIANLRGIFGPEKSLVVAGLAADGTVRELQTETHRIRLEGIVVYRQKRMALVSLTPIDKEDKGKKGKEDRPEKRKVVEGDELFSFTVTRIESHTITLLNRADKREVKLVIFKTNVTEG